MVQLLAPSLVCMPRLFPLLFAQAAGITHLWLPPPSQSVSPQGYLPGQVRPLTSGM